MPWSCCRIGLAAGDPTLTRRCGPIHSGFHFARLVRTTFREMISCVAKPELLALTSPDPASAWHRRRPLDHARRGSHRPAGRVVSLIWMRHRGLARALLSAGAAAALVVLALVGTIGTTGTAQAATAVLPCNIYASGGTPCVAAYSLVRALYGSYDGPLYQVTRTSDGTTKKIDVLKAGGYGDAAPKKKFYYRTVCCIP